ncbi:MAG: valine--tRNA ligase [Gammaproteobacteria bacterium CG_4_10_14_0_8_um_filter_38_16]|nr:MAG: valine--tRNA ligase [Gammaproteobacteria bacterium CG_4_10_14_0_8_um_filter_38_16]PJA04170.1 MAG: valine--tRNA ligase [Gammaproteobacteria bacterium CG_4_10_14_0_2_um_filter_38_22]PJB10113.1 MAG: valine--tRNA ligase [Gammaproteobacteria bacterium CG_4_9_14_3_um_filter_38_9]
MRTTELEKTYQPTEIESKWSKYWEKQNFSQPSSSGDAYCIMLPPPNVTGTLHMGHGFQHTLMDALIRFHRMQGDSTLWQAGTDHAGIATQMVVERQLAQQNISRHDLGRDAFLKKVWHWKHQSGETITQQIRRMGASIDWTRERFTMDDNISHATINAFVRLYDEGLIYRGKKLVNWDPQLKTAISDLEVSTETEKGHLWHIRYPIADSHDSLVIATTRPETLLGDTAVAVHPDDGRYKKWIGKKIRLPLTERLIPIIADDMVDREFGTGCVKITPAHDFNDYAMGQRHHLPVMNVMTLDAKLNEAVPEKYRGLDRFVARKKILEDLTALHLLEKTEDHEHNIPRGDRSGVIIEPLLTDQWFVKMDDMAKAAIDAYNQNEVEFVPENWGKTYLQWLENIQDWCISRQLWWGHRIPVWYDTDGKHYVGLHEKAVREKYKLSHDVTLQQDNDVLDTWFSAALWPLATLGWPDNTQDLEKFYPTSVLVTGFDIIFFWVARMVMLGLKFMKKVPFKQVYITGLIRDSQGQKMSKSKGNILDPIDLVDGISLEKLLEKRTTGLMQPQMQKKIETQTKKEFADGIPASGTDALRFTFCALATQGRNINFDLARLTGYRNFCNKIWNATRFVLMNIGDCDITNQSRILSMADQWILHQLQLTITQAHNLFKQYRFDQLAKLLYEFVWNDYCDWYLELSKCDLARDHISEAEKRGTKHTLIAVLETILRLLHPLMPFITEEIWQQVAPLLSIKGKTIMLQPYPKTESNKLNVMAEAQIKSIKRIITDIRTIRSESNISPAKKINVIVDKGNACDILSINKYDYYLKSLAKIEKLTSKNTNEILPECIAMLSDSLEINIPLAGLIDRDAELTRLKKEIEKLEKQKTQMESRLNNAAFVDKAPAAEVEKVRIQLTSTQQTLTKLLTQYEKINSMQ